MVSIANHGGSCCGARHIFSFDRIIQNGDNFNSIETALLQVPVGRRVEAILNRRQVTSELGQEVLNKLAELGFVLSEHYMNHNHSPARDNYVFTRCDTRRDLVDLPFTWNGQVIDRTLTGNLPAVPAVPAETGEFGPVDITQPMEFEDSTPVTFDRHYGEGRAIITWTRPPNPVGRRSVPFPSCWYNLATGGYGGNEGAYLRIRNVRTFNVGDRVRVTNENSHYFGSTGCVTNVGNTNLTIRLDEDYSANLRKTSCTLIERAGAAPVEAPPVVPMRHTTTAIDVATPVRVVYSTFHNVYRDGRVGAGYPTIGEVTNAAPRCLSRVRRDISSDGTVTDIPL